MQVTRVSRQSFKIYDKNLTKQGDLRQEQRVPDERKNKQNAKIAEEQRIEMNRRMGRNGQNIDKIV